MIIRSAELYGQRFLNDIDLLNWLEGFKISMRDWKPEEVPDGRAMIDKIIKRLEELR